MTDRRPILVVAYSARALASSAARAGFAPLAIDVFGDEDTREASFASIILEGGLASGFTPDNIMRAVDTLIDANHPIGLVYGAGFEHQPETIAALSEKIRVYGNDADVLQRAKDPLALAQMCETKGVRHPQVVFSPPDNPELWLMKQQGGAGGAHIGSADVPSGGPPDRYFQRRVAGRSVSALFLAAENKAAIVGLSLQWTAPTESSPFRYGGAAGPIDVEPAEARAVARAVAALASEFDLVGLNSADFIVSADGVSLIEINPRPGATLDVFESSTGALFAHHIAACEGRLTPPPPPSTYKAAEIVYAPYDVVVSGPTNWPEWAVDRPALDSRIGAGDPLCTALASGATADLARMCASERAQAIVALVQEAVH